MATTRYTAKGLAREARLAVQGQAKAAGFRARLDGWELVLDHQPGEAGDRVSLVAQGEAIEAGGLRSGLYFTVAVAI